MRISNLIHWFLTFFFFMIGLVPCIAEAQISRGEIPNSTYWLAMAVYRNGELASARKGFQDAAKNGIVSTDGRWVDSICFHTMIGECEHRLGNNAAALEQYTAALKLYVAKQNWMLSFDFPANIEASNSPVLVTWGNSTRNTRMGKYPEKYSYIRDTLTAIPGGAGGGTGGLMTGKEAVAVNAAEISRCIALAIRRRKEIMGIVGPVDPLTNDILAACSRRPTPPNNWTQCWADVHVGLAYAAAGKFAQAASELTRGLQAGGTLDHHLTSAALLELGHIALGDEKFEAAGIFFLEATYSAAQFDLYDDMEEGFRGAQLCWILMGKNNVLPALAPGIQWANAKRQRKLEVALRLLAADNMTILGDTPSAKVMVQSLEKAMLRSELGNSRYGIRGLFELARVNFAEGDLATGANNLGSAMKFQQASSRWLYQLSLADSIITSGAGGISERESDTLYATLLRDPSTNDWLADPLEALTVASSSYPAALEHWFLLTLQRKEIEKAMEIADRLRRHKFYATLPLGGRLLSLRWILEAPDELLTATALNEKQNLLLKYPPYGQVSAEAKAVQKDLSTLPLISDDDAQKKQQQDLFAKLAKLSTTQEVMLRNIALRREPSEYVFPPVLVVKELQAKISPRTLIFAYLHVNGKLHGFAIGKERVAHFQPESMTKIKADLTTVLKTWGLLDKMQNINVKDLQSDAWRAPARRLLQTCTNQMPDANWEQFDELVLVPDSILWYVPWEALPIADAPDAPPLISKIKVRIVPTLSLAAPDNWVKKPFDRTALVAGKLYPRDEVSVAAAQCDKLKEAFPQSARLMANIPAPSSLLLSQADQLLVFHDMEETTKVGYDWAPCPVDKGKSASALTEWFSLPWSAPRQVILPGFNTPAASALKRGGTGDDLFLTACAFMASGSRTVLLSRWRNGGQTSYDLVREFAVESAFSTADTAWQRSVQLLRQNPLLPDREPRLEPSEKLDGMLSEHPVFWSGYLLIDSGAVPPEMKK